MRPTVAIMRMLFGAALSLALLAGPTGCGGGDGKSGPTTPGSDSAESSARAPVSSEGKSWGGWRWKGKRDSCFFVVDNKCFDSRAKACTAAKCDKGKRKRACVTDGAAPAKVSCKKKK